MEKCIPTQLKPDLIVSSEGRRYVKTEQLNRDLILFNFWLHWVSTSQRPKLPTHAYNELWGVGIVVPLCSIILLLHWKMSSQAWHVPARLKACVASSHGPAATNGPTLFCQCPRTEVPVAHPFASLSGAVPHAHRHKISCPEFLTIVHSPPHQLRNQKFT